MDLSLTLASRQWLHKLNNKFDQHFNSNKKLLRHGTSIVHIENKQNILNCDIGGELTN